MARKTSAKVILNRQALTAFGTDLAEGFGEVARTIVETADPPDETPYGAGLVRNGGWLVFLGKTKVAGGGLDGRQPAKPRGFTTDEGISAIGGYGFPGRFQEMGTVKQAAKPFLWPAVLRVKDDIPDIMKRAVGAWSRKP